MPYADLREYIARLEGLGDLLRIKREVDWNLELGAIMRRANDLREPALLFEKIKGYSSDYPVFANVIGAGKPNPYGRTCVALEMPVETRPVEIIDELVRRFSRPLKPVLVDRGPCKENILRGDEVDLLKFPAPHLRALDGGRYIGTFHTQVNRDPDSGWVNWGMYRSMLHDKSSAGWLAIPGQQGPGIYYQKYEARGKAMPMAIAIGTDPAVAFASLTSFPAFIDEADMAGAIRGAPVELVKCETNDLEVPATAEIVLEGEIRPNERRDEGPFGEYTGYLSSQRAPRLVFHVQCITHRNNPILTVSSPGKPFDDTTFVYSLFCSAVLTIELRKRGLPFKSLYMTPSMLAVIVSASETYPGFVHTLSSAIWSTKVGVYRPTIIVVGEDIDVSNMDEVMWAMTTRMHPARDIHIVERAPAHPLYPFLSPEERENLVGANVCFDATFPAEWKDNPMQIVDFEHSWPKEIQEMVISRWREYGFV
ncbi:MAG: UbiD family decarboxylase [Desulfobacterales bacterium]|nr:UbiD family decarboxylase [Desulfobacterales bacterium]